jgi:hypothetical protein
VGKTLYIVTTDLSVCLDSRFDKVIEKEKKRKEKKYKRIVSCIANHPSAHGAIKDWQTLITEL